MDGSVVALLGFMCILLLAGGMYFLFSRDDQIDAGGESGKGKEEGSNPKSCTEYECPTLYTKRDNAQYLETDDQDSPVNSCCVPRTCQLVDCSESARRSDPEKLTAVIDFIDKDNEDARVNFCCIATKESEELEKQQFWVIFWIVIASVIGLVGISGILTFNGWRGLIELPYMILSVPGNAIMSLGKVFSGYGRRYGSGEKRWDTPGTECAVGGGVGCVGSHWCFPCVGSHWCFPCVGSHWCFPCVGSHWCFPYARDADGSVVTLENFWVKTRPPN